MGNYSNHPEKIILAGYVTIILIGTLFLILPISTTENISLIDALFTSTSAVCVTGLIVQDTQYYFTMFGKTVILILLQIGGLGYMTLSTALIILISKNISGPERYQTQNEFQRFTVKDIRNFVFKIINFTLIVELIGTLLLYPKMYILLHDVKSAIWNALFHSVSAFCNAGFSTFSTNLLVFKNDIYVNTIIAFLIIIGGLGFIVLGDLYRNTYVKRKKLSVHSKIVLITTFILIIIPFIIYFFIERDNSLIHMSLFEKIANTFFQIITPRTAGFNTINFSILAKPTIFLIIILMFIGGSPGGTAGGIKTTTIFVILYSIYQKLKGRKNVNIFYRRISEEIILKSFFIFTLSIIVISIGMFLISLTEGASSNKILFEVFSAYSTVGLSLGSDIGYNYSLSGDFSIFGKIIIIFIMFTGRVGIMTATNAFISKRKKETISYPKTKLTVG